MQYSGQAVTAPNLVYGMSYTIQYVGTTDFTLAGASANTVGTTFVATQATTGDGIAYGNVAYNVAVGESALYGNYYGSYNTGVGTETLYHNLSGVSNVAVGSSALAFNSRGSYNTGVGRRALYNNGIPITDVTTLVGSTTYVIRSIGTTDFTLIGATSNTIGLSFVASGPGTGTGQVWRPPGDNNTAIGYDALFQVDGGSNNVAVGYQAGQSLVSGSNNVLIGGYAGTAGMAGNVVLSTGNGTVRFQHDGTNWTSATPISTTGLILPSTTSPITLNASVGTSGQVLTSAGSGATPTWTTSYGPSFVTYTSSATTVDQVIDTNATSAAGTVKYTVQITSGGERHSCEILVTHDGTNTVSTEYAVIDTGAGSLATFNTDINAGNLRLLTTPTNAVTVYKILKTIIAP
jgi:hypothetical protein